MHFYTTESVMVLPIQYAEAGVYILFVNNSQWLRNLHIWNYSLSSQHFGYGFKSGSRQHVDCINVLQAYPDMIIHTE